MGTPGGKQREGRMLKFLRRKKNSKIIMIVLGAIILVFIFWGMWTGKGNKADSDIVALVDGDAIKLKDYENAYKRQLDYYREAFKGNLTDEFLERLNLKQRTLDTLINRILILNDAEGKGVQVSDEELAKSIQGIAAFHKDGAFDKETYLEVLKRNRMFPGDFEEMVRGDLTIQRMQKEILDGVEVSDDEVKERFTIDNRKINLNYLSVSASEIEKGVEVSDEEAKAYLERNKEAFRVPARIKAAYASIEFTDLLREVDVSEEEMKAYYDSNKATFEIPEKEVRTSHILIRPSGDDDGAWEKARKKAEGILKRVRKGEDFGRLAGKYSQDPGSAAKGGELDYFRRGTMVKPFEDAAFSLKKGEVSEPVKTTFGYHIIKVTDIKGPGTAPFKDVKSDIKEVLKREKAKALARSKIADLEKPFKDGAPLKELEAISKEKGIRFTVTGYLTERKRLDDLVRYDKLREKVFLMKREESSVPIELPHGIYIVRVTERVDSHLPDYIEAESEVKKVVARSKAEVEAGEKAGSILERLKKGEEMSAVAAEEGLKIEESGFITKMNAFIPKAGLNLAGRDSLFLLTGGSPYYDELVRSGGRIFILKMKESREPDEKDFEANKDAIRSKILSEKQNEAMAKWINGLREDARIEVNTNAL